jgi:ATP-dependent Clp protease ATP-binding subunit ClpA
MFERFTNEARAVTVSAQTYAREMAHNHIGTEHQLLALLDPTSGATATILADVGLDAARVKADIERYFATSEIRLGEKDAEALESIGINLDAVKRKIEETFGPGALEPTIYEERRGLFRRRKVSYGSRWHIPFTPRAKKVFELSLREAIRLKHKHICSEHILLGMIREGEGLAMKIMVDAGVDVDEVRRRATASLN